jgi:hypothetical protein
MAVNLNGVFNVTHAFLAQLRVREVQNETSLAPG